MAWLFLLENEEIRMPFFINVQSARLTAYTSKTFFVSRLKTRIWIYSAQKMPKQTSFPSQCLHLIRGLINTCEWCDFNDQFIVSSCRPDYFACARDYIIVFAKTSRCARKYKSRNQAARAGMFPYHETFHFVQLLFSKGIALKGCASRREEL